MIKIILNLLPAEDGSINIFGKSHYDFEAKHSFAYLPEKFIPSPYLKGEEFLDLSIGYYRLKYDSNEAEKLCEELGLEKTVLKKRIGNYSKGMGQKLALIATFLTQAPLLILDEPMSGLDPSARIALKRKLLAYKEGGGSVFFSSHILSDVEEICDKIGILSSGCLIFNGSSPAFIKKYKAKNLEEAFLKAIDVV